ncbi:hypothetical protein EPA93_17180 [Ktedonosporobacter rubrisoli]|uniref:Uncharacterized protein n=1 Tax=Ktedonosporobacter rubrisoli TaxID=2509675 RepID=A0A4P6JQT9_KTERU|nr:hypothetical protein [Ktedonosporobacter rubrisoli]QBD77633.1 hypothetical protein EPA93_17180 [Ktedonosporobacter rubrisoli]
MIRQPFCGQLEERFMLWLEYHPLVASYARDDIGPKFATKYRLPIPQHAPFAIGYTFENTPIITCPISWARWTSEHRSSPRWAWRTTNGEIVICSKPRPHDGLPACNKASSGLAPSVHAIR